MRCQIYIYIYDGERVEVCDALDIPEGEHHVSFSVHHQNAFHHPVKGEREQLIPFLRELYPDAHLATRVLGEVLGWLLNA